MSPATTRRGPRTLLHVAVGLVVGACAPKAAPLTGALAPTSVVPPSARLERPQQIGFRWEYREDELTARGDGAARLAPPDSARLDLFLEGGLGAAAAWVFGDRIDARVPMAERVIPPAAMFWAALGRLAVPPGDTAVRIDEGAVRAEITGTRGTFRVAFRQDSLMTLERIVDGRIVDRVERNGATVLYRHPASRRSLTLTIVRRVPVDAFDPAIWPH